MLGRSRRVEVTGPRGANGSLCTNRFGNVATKHKVMDMAAMSPRRTAYVVALPNLPGGAAPRAPRSNWWLAWSTWHWTGLTRTSSFQRLAGRHQRLVEQTADVELVARLLAEPGVDPNAAASVSDGHGEVDKYQRTPHGTTLTHACGTPGAVVVKSVSSV